MLFVLILRHRSRVELRERSVGGVRNHQIVLDPIDARFEKNELLNQSTVTHRRYGSRERSHASGGRLGDFDGHLFRNHPEIRQAAQSGPKRRFTGTDLHGRKGEISRRLRPDLPASRGRAAPARSHRAACRSACRRATTGIGRHAPDIARSRTAAAACRRAEHIFPADKRHAVVDADKTAVGFDPLKAFEFRRRGGRLELRAAADAGTAANATTTAGTATATIAATDAAGADGTGAAGTLSPERRRENQTE